jgi:hypothetical protein
VLAEVRPIDLTLIAGQGLEALESLGGLTRSMTRDDAPEVIGAARIAALPHHLEQPTGAESGVLLELLHQERDERIGHRRARHDGL